MDDATEPLIFTCTHGAEAPERATVPFIAAAVAAASGRRTVVVCTIEGVRVGTPGYADRVESDDQPPLADLLARFLDAGGDLWLCSACTTKRDITGDDVIDGAQIVGAAQIVELLAAGRSIALGG